MITLDRYLIEIQLVVAANCESKKIAAKGQNGHNVDVCQSTCIFPHDVADTVCRVEGVVELLLHTGNYINSPVVHRSEYIIPAHSVCSELYGYEVHIIP